MPRCSWLLLLLLAAGCRPPVAAPKPSPPAAQTIDELFYQPMKLKREVWKRFDAATGVDKMRLAWLLTMFNLDERERREVLSFLRGLAPHQNGDAGESCLLGLLFLGDDEAALEFLREAQGEVGKSGGGLAWNFPMLTHVLDFLGGDLFPLRYLRSENADLRRVAWNLLPRWRDGSADLAQRFAFDPEKPPAEQKAVLDEIEKYAVERERGRRCSGQPFLIGP